MCGTSGSGVLTEKLLIEANAAIHERDEARRKCGHRMFLPMNREALTAMRLYVAPSCHWRKVRRARRLRAKLGDRP